MTIEFFFVVLVNVPPVLFVGLSGQKKKKKNFLNVCHCHLTTTNGKW